MLSSKYSLDKLVAEQARTRARAGRYSSIGQLAARVHKEISCVVESLSEDKAVINEHIIAVGLDGKFNELRSWHIRLYIGEQCD